MGNWDVYGPVVGGDKVDFMGDSCSELAPQPWNEGGIPYYANAGGLVDQINTILPPSTTGVNGASSTGSRATSTGAPGQVLPTLTSRSINVTGFGTGGQTAVAAAAGNAIALMQTRIPADTVSPVIVMQWSINDIYAIAGGSSSVPETIPDFEAALASLYAQVYAAFPHARIVYMGSFAFNEKHTDGPPASWGPGNDIAGTTNIDTVTTSANASMAAAAAANGAKFADQHDGFLLPWEVINNPTNLLGNVAAVPNGAGGAAVHYKTVAMTEIAAPAFLAVVPVG